MHGEAPTKTKRKRSSKGPRIITAVDLFCGAVLGQAQFGHGTDTKVGQFMVRRAQHPEHVSFVPFHRSPSTVPFVSRFVGSFQDAALVALDRLAHSGQVRIPLVKAGDQRITTVLVISTLIVTLHRIWVASIKGCHRFTLSFSRALGIAILSVYAHRRGDRKFLFTKTTGSLPVEVMIGLFSASFVRGIGVAFVRAIASSVLFGQTLERRFTSAADNQIHTPILPLNACIYGGLAG
jgi:hypothetical protein